MTMKKTIKYTMSPTARNRGFTLIEMLVVAALLAIFAGLAVFNIVEQLNREKEKAAIAEARSIATGMSFAHSDLGFYPRLSWLRFGQEELTRYILDNGLPGEAIDWFGRGNSAVMANRIRTQWGEKYMSGGMAEKSVTMNIAVPGGIISERWPADPWNQPYMGYFIKIERPQGGGNPVIQWADDSLGDKANYFAGIVSYGRNLVPGHLWNDTNAFNVSSGKRLFGDVAGEPRTFQTSNNYYTQEALDWFVNLQPNPIQTVAPFNNPPHMRDAGSDDKYYEF